MFNLMLFMVNGWQACQGLGPVMPSVARIWMPSVARICQAWQGYAKRGKDMPSVARIGMPIVARICQAWQGYWGQMFPVSLRYQIWSGLKFVSNKPAARKAMPNSQTMASGCICVSSQNNSFYHYQIKCVILCRRTVRGQTGGKTEQGHCSVLIV